MTPFSRTSAKHRHKPDFVLAKRVEQEDTRWAIKARTDTIVLTLFYFYKTSSYNVYLNLIAVRQARRDHRPHAKAYLHVDVRCVEIATTLLILAKELGDGCFRT